MLRYTDPRRFGAWLWCKDLDSSNVLAHLGPAPLSAEFDGDYLYHQPRRKTTAVKAGLMDNKVVVGVGNIYARESLVTARISPDRPAGSLTKKDADVLVATINAVLLRSIEQGGTTLKDFLQSDGKPGSSAHALPVYGRAGEACRVCGEKILRGIHGQRTTFFCPRCQK